MNTFADILAAKLDARDWKAEHLSAALLDVGRPVTVSAIGRWLDGSRSPEYGTLPYLAQALVCDPGDLIPSPPSGAQVSHQPHDDDSAPACAPEKDGDTAK